MCFLTSANPIDHVLWAAENGNVETLRSLLSVEPGLVHVKDSDGYTPLHRAAYGNHFEAVCYLLTIGASVGSRTQLGWTPLHSACNWNHYKIAARLLAANANPKALSDGGKYIFSINDVHQTYKSHKFKTMKIQCLHQSQQ